MCQTVRYELVQQVTPILLNKRDLPAANMRQWRRRWNIISSCSRLQEQRRLGESENVVIASNICRWSYKIQGKIFEKTMIF